MKVVISIPVHEKKDVIADQIKNIQFYLEDPIILLHISKQFYEEEEGNFGELNCWRNVYINPLHFPAGWGNIAHIHISNFRYACQVCEDFTYFMMHASNELYVRKGVEAYMSRYEAGIQRRLLLYSKSMWGPCGFAFRDEKLKAIMKRCQADILVGSQVEGSFYRKEIFEKITAYIGSDVFWEGESYTREEIYFPTIAYCLLKEEALGYPVTFSEVHRYDEGLWRLERLLYSVSRLPVLKRFLSGSGYETLHQRAVRRYQESGIYKIRKKDIKRIRKYHRAVSERKRMRDYPGVFQLYGKESFAVKRVPRQMDAPIREYIRRKMDEDIMSQRLLEEGK